ncbi:hypothetical protein ACOME3_005493 [Neoechinorhynchus agilis]
MEGLHRGVYRRSGRVRLVRVELEKRPLRGLSLSGEQLNACSQGREFPFTVSPHRHVFEPENSMPKRSPAATVVAWSSRPTAVIGKAFKKSLEPIEMPKSRKDKKVSLTSVKRKQGRQVKLDLISKFRQMIDKYDRLFVFSLHNEKNSALKEARLKWRDSGTIFLGKNKVLRVALGKDDRSAYRTNSHLVSSLLVGKIGILMTNKTESEVLDWFKTFGVTGYARAGDVCPQDVTIYNEDVSTFGYAAVPQLRKLGLDVEMDNGVVKLSRNEQQICKNGDKLAPEQANLLERFGYQLSRFHLKALCQWEIKNGGFMLLDE